MLDQYCRVITPEPAINEETEEVCALLQQCYALRYSPAIVCSPLRCMFQGLDNSTTATAHSLQLLVCPAYRVLDNTRKLRSSVGFQTITPTCIVQQPQSSGNSFGGAQQFLWCRSDSPARTTLDQEMLWCIQGQVAVYSQSVPSRAAPRLARGCSALSHQR